MSNKVKTIKQAQREKLLLREFSDLFLQITFDQPQLQKLLISRVALSPDRSICYVFFYLEEGEDAFKDLLDMLTLYKSSLRTALARRINARYAPDLVFRFDTLFAKQQRIESLIESLKQKDES